MHQTLDSFMVLLVPFLQSKIIKEHINSDHNGSQKVFKKIFKF